MKVWKHFQDFSGLPFLAATFSYALMLNIDWFQPFVVYLAFMNLPRHLQYKRKNKILLGIIPGPTEPHHGVNSFLKPLVSELKQLWDGVLMEVPRTISCSGGVRIQCALLCVECDLPAGCSVWLLVTCCRKGMCDVFNVVSLIYALYRLCMRIRTNIVCSHSVYILGVHHFMIRIVHESTLNETRAVTAAPSIW